MDANEREQRREHDGEAVEGIRGFGSNGELAALPVLVPVNFRTTELEQKITKGTKSHESLNASLRLWPSARSKRRK